MGLVVVNSVGHSALYVCCLFAVIWCGFDCCLWWYIGWLWWWGSFCSGCLWVVLVCFALRVVVVLMVDLMLMLVFMIGVLRWVSV